MPDLPWFVYAMLLAPFGLIVVAAIYKTLEVRAARDWPSTPGKVVVSNSEVRKIRVLDDTHADGHNDVPRNFANIVYEYTVSGQKLRNNRVSIGEDRGDFQVAETIAKYPVGTAVTVYYNSLHPKEAVLERDLPQGIWGCVGIGAVVVPAIVFGGAFGISHFNDFVGAHFVDPKLSPLVLAMVGFGLAIALFGLAFHRQSSLAKQWPVTTGTIRISTPEVYQAASSESGRTGSVMYETTVSYAFRFKNVAYSNVHATISSSSDPKTSWLVRRVVSNHRNGDSVKVYVNPQNPAESTIDPGGKAAWFLWSIAAGFVVCAYYIATQG